MPLPADPGRPRDHGFADVSRTWRGAARARSRRERGHRGRWREDAGFAVGGRASVRSSRGERTRGCGRRGPAGPRPCRRRRRCRRAGREAERTTRDGPAPAPGRCRAAVAPGRDGGSPRSPGGGRRGRARPDARPGTTGRRPVGRSRMAGVPRPEPPRRRGRTAASSGAVGERLPPAAKLCEAGDPQVAAVMADDRPALVDQAASVAGEQSARGDGVEVAPRIDPVPTRVRFRRRRGRRGRACGGGRGGPCSRRGASGAWPSREPSAPAGRAS